MDSIITRYISILNRQIYLKDPNSLQVSEPLEGDETNDIHLLWMLRQIRYNSEQSETKKHRWLGYVQGVMTVKGYINVLEERELTRDIFNGK